MSPKGNRMLMISSCCACEKPQKSCKGETCFSMEASVKNAKVKIITKCKSIVESPLPQTIFLFNVFLDVREHLKV